MICVNHKLKGLKCHLSARGQLRLHFSYLVYENNTSVIMPRSDLSFSDKQKIIDVIIDHERRGKTNFASIAKDFNINRSTVSRISRDCSKFQDADHCLNLGKKRQRTSSEQDVDKALFMWYAEKLVYL